mmetsp:Transcript_2006/g.5859  ORF Transcript_2006/g.5859 Transcript_2006/m.5859 type:complete len:255 (+) Transcript_2006:302-1066(+)
MSEPDQLRLTPQASPAAGERSSSHVCPSTSVAASPKVNRRLWRPCTSALAWSSSTTHERFRSSLDWVMRCTSQFSRSARVSLRDRPSSDRLFRRRSPTTLTTAHDVLVVTVPIVLSFSRSLENTSPFTPPGMWSSVRDTAYCDVATRSTETSSSPKGAKTRERNPASPHMLRLVMLIKTWPLRWVTARMTLALLPSFDTLTTEFDMSSPAMRVKGPSASSVLWTSTGMPAQDAGTRHLGWSTLAPMDASSWATR